MIHKKPEFARTNKGNVYFQRNNKAQGLTRLRLNLKSTNMYSISIHYRISMLTLWAFALVLFAAHNPKPAWAEACTASSCESKDAASMQCDRDALVLEIADIVDTSQLENNILGTVTFYYSPRCRAKWSSVMGASEHPITVAFATLYDGVGKIVGGRGKRFSLSTGALVTSLMTDSRHIVTACGRIMHPASSRGGQGCTSAH